LPAWSSASGDHYFSNTDCFKDQTALTLEQAGANVTKGYKGGLDAGSRVPITEDYKVRVRVRFRARVRNPSPT